jgi:DNA polymerase
MLKKPFSCHGCPAHEVGEGYVPGGGDTTAKIALVGQGPGKTEAWAGEPFVGPSGSMLDEWLRKAGIKRNKCWVDNVVRCWLPRNRAPRKGEVEHCTRVHLRQGLAKLENLKVVVPVGTVAIKHFMGPEAGESAVGAITRMEL